MIEKILMGLGMGWKFILPTFVAYYIFVSWAYMDIGVRAEIKNPELAWIPFAGPLLVVYMASGMGWWPWLLLAAQVIPLVGVLAIVVFLVYEVVWTWKTFEGLGHPGWWSVLTLLPLVGVIIVGVVAWCKRD